LLFYTCVLAGAEHGVLERFAIVAAIGERQLRATVTLVEDVGVALREFDVRVGRVCARSVLWGGGLGDGNKWVDEGGVVQADVVRLRHTCKAVGVEVAVEAVEGELGWLLGGFAGVVDVAVGRRLDQAGRGAEEAVVGEGLFDEAGGDRGLVIGLNWGRRRRGWTGGCGDSVGRALALVVVEVLGLDLLCSLGSAENGGVTLDLAGPVAHAQLSVPP